MAPKKKKAAPAPQKPPAKKPIKTRAPAKRRATQKPIVKAHKPAVPVAPPAIEARETILGDEKLSRRYDVSTRTIQSWRKAGMPHEPAGRNRYRYDTSKTDPWKVVHEKKAGVDSDPDSFKAKQAILKEKAEQEAIETALLRNKLGKEEQNLIERRTIELAIATILTQFGDWCEQLPEIIDGECCKSCKAKIGKRLKEELDKRREDLADDLARGHQAHE
jgi:hypothetical protein